jgi:hypothetical protein
MNKVRLVLSLAILGSVALVGCKKKGCMDEAAANYSADAKKDDGTCNYKPVITIVGANPATVSVGAEYTDGGATAFVKNEGNVTVTSDLSQVNTSSVGSFNVTYTASNANGTTTATRLVNVVLGQSSYLGNYTTVQECTITQFPVNGSAQVIAGASANQLIIQDAFTGISGNINLTFAGSQITAPQQTVVIEVFGIPAGDLTFTGTGVMNDNATSMTITYTYSNTVPAIGGEGTCTVTYNK